MCKFLALPQSTLSASQAIDVALQNPNGVHQSTRVQPGRVVGNTTNAATNVDSPPDVDAELPPQFSNFDAASRDDAEAGDAAEFRRSEPQRAYAVSCIKLYAMLVYFSRKIFSSFSGHRNALKTQKQQPKNV